MEFQDNSLYMDGISTKKEMKAYIGTLLQNNRTFVAENTKLRQAVDKYTEAVKSLQDENKELTEKCAALELAASRMKITEMEQLAEFAEVISEGKKMMNQMLERSEQETRQKESAARQLLEETHLQAQCIRNQSAREMEGILETFRKVGYLARESKKGLAALCDEAEDRVLRYVEQMEAMVGRQSAENSEQEKIGLIADKGALSNE